MKVLVVDDDMSLAALVVRVLKKWGYQADTVFDGRGALKKLKDEKADVVLLDLFLPDCRGYELIPEFKKVWPEVHVISITGYSSRELETEVRRQGVVFYMFKPFDFELLKAIIDHMQEKKKTNIYNIN